MKKLAALLRLLGLHKLAERLAPPKQNIGGPDNPPPPPPP